MIEVVGDSARGGEWAFVRLRVDGDRIVDADADGLERSLAGLTLLEAAAVSGDTLAVDALAERDRTGLPRLAPIRRRVAVAMSGGVDSAVALLRAGPARRRRHAAALARPGGPGRRARLLLARGRPGGTRDVPRARPSARHARSPRGVPPRRRRAVRPRLRARRDAEPVHALQRRLPLRRAARVRAPRRRRAARDRPLRAHRRAHRGRRLLARAADEAKDQSYMLARLDPRRLERVWFPLGDQRKEETRAEAAARRARRRASRGEPGGVLPRRRRLPRVPGAARARVARRADRRPRTGREVGRHDGHWRFTAGQRRGLGVVAAEPLYVVGTRPATNTVVVGSRDVLARTA